MKGGDHTEEYSLIIWIALAVVFAVVEAVTVQLVTVWFAVGAVGAVVANVLGAGEAVQLTVFVLLSVATLVLSRPYVKKFTKTMVQPTNADRLIGDTAVVTEAIDNLHSKGTVRVSGLEWMARTADGKHIAAGETVTVVQIEGAKLIVEKKPEKQED